MRNELASVASTSQSLRINGSCNVFSVVKPMPTSYKIHHLVKNKFPRTEIIGAQRKSSRLGYYLYFQSSFILDFGSTDGSSQNSNKQDTAVTKNFVINGKSLPLKVVKLIPKNQLKTRV